MSVYYCITSCDCYYETMHNDVNHQTVNENEKDEKQYGYTNRINVL